MDTAGKTDKEIIAILEDKIKELIDCHNKMAERLETQDKLLHLLAQKSGWMDDEIKHIYDIQKDMYLKAHGLLPPLPHTECKFVIVDKDTLKEVPPRDPPGIIARFKKILRMS